MAAPPALRGAAAPPAAAAARHSRHGIIGILRASADASINPAFCGRPLRACIPPAQAVALINKN
jgi:hypothetical protein